MRTCLSHSSPNFNSDAYFLMLVIVFRRDQGIGNQYTNAKNISFNGK